MKLRADRRRIRKAEAGIRNEVWRALTPEEQLAIVRSRPGESKRQVEKIEKMIRDGKAQSAKGVKQPRPKKHRSDEDGRKS